MFLSRGLLSALNVCYLSCTLIIAFFKPNLVKVLQIHRPSISSQ